MRTRYLLPVLLVLCSSASAGWLVADEPAALADRALASSECDKDCAIRRKVDRHLLLMGEFGNDREQQASLRELAAIGPPAVRAVVEAYDDWARAQKPDPAVDARPGEMRWRATYLLGALGHSDARRALYDIARTQAATGARGDVDFADQARVQVRAVAGLQQLKAIDELKALHEIGGSLGNSTAAALFELGVDVGGVSLVEARLALAQEKAETRDHKPGKGRPPQAEKPGSQRFNVKPRGDTPAMKTNGG